MANALDLKHFVAVFVFVDLKNVLHKSESLRHLNENCAGMKAFAVIKRQNRRLKDKDTDCLSTLQRETGLVACSIVGAVSFAATLRAVQEGNAATSRARPLIFCSQDLQLHSGKAPTERLPDEACRGSNSNSDSAA